MAASRLAELTTAVVRLNLPVKVMILKNTAWRRVRFEQADLGYKPFGIELGAIGFVAFAKACGASRTCRIEAGRLYVLAQNAARSSSMPAPPARTSLSRRRFGETVMTTEENLAETEALESYDIVEEASEKRPREDR